MNVLELKQTIKDLAAEIKVDKTELRKPHVYPSSGELQSRLCGKRGRIHAYYYLYAFLRGKSPASVDSGRKLTYGQSSLIQWHALKMLPAEAHPLFMEWLSEMKLS